MLNSWGGAFLASLAISHGVNIAKAKEPTQIYLMGFEYVFSNPQVVLAATILFVVISQVKINVTNAYAGSLAWSNFFSRLTHSHPGRVVWLVFNVTISLLIMELGVFSTLEAVLGLYSNVAIAWVGALVADLAINKPLGISPPYVEFRRAYLYNFNPVGFGSTLIASAVAITAFIGVFGSVAKAFAPFIALGLAFALAPAIAIFTKGKYYIARADIYYSHLPTKTIDCCICEQEYELQDIAFCPAYDRPICSLCCTLNARCRDVCKTTNIKNNQSLLKLNKTPFKEFFQHKLSPPLGQKSYKLSRYFYTFIYFSWDNFRFYILSTSFNLARIVYQ